MDIIFERTDYTYSNAHSAFCPVNLLEFTRSNLYNLESVSLSLFGRENG